MNVLLNGKIKSPRKLLRNKGTMIVVIECRMLYLTEHKGLDGYLIPYAKNSYSSQQKFARIRKQSLPVLYQSQSINRFDQVLLNESIGDLDLRKFKLSDYDVGLLFLYRENKYITKPKVTSEYFIQEDFDHEMLNGVVLSHWHRNSNFTKFKKQYLETVGNVYPAQGFGSRYSAKSEGINVYTGMKSSSRAIGNPFMEPSQVPFNQLWSSNGDITYHPVVNKIVNAFTTESSYVMKACTSLLHCFIEEVYRKTYQMSQNQFHTFRGYNSLSILTAGSASTRTDGFYNTIHTDVNDCLDPMFQHNAIEILNELKSCTERTSEISTDIDYLEQLSKCCNGFATPTTCGYTILESRDEDSCDLVDFNASFLLVGLGMTVSIDSNDFYHTFFASAVSHCTAVPVTTLHNRVCSIYTGRFNIVGWGAGSAKAKKVYDNHFDADITNHGQRMKAVSKKSLIAWLQRTNIPAAIQEWAEENSR